MNTAENATVDVTMLTLDEIKSKLQDRKLYVVSKATGLSYPTLKKLHDGECANFNMVTIQKVSNYFSEDVVNTPSNK